MSARAGDWGALDLAGDPVPGDADEVEAEATHYGSVARTISAQVARLRRLAEGDESLKGEYAESLKDSCGELAGDLQKAQGRFETVGEQLGRVAEPLRAALRETKAALDDAVDARARMSSARGAGYDPEVPWAVQNAPGPDGEQNPGIAAAKRAFEDAEADLAAAKRRCGAAVDGYDQVASSAAAQIRAAADDDLKDGRFEGFKAWVRANADFLRQLSTWLGRIVIVLAVAIVLISNPAGWLVLAAALTAVALLAVDTVLALAGEGSWTDVAFSALGVLTLGAGSLVGKLARFGRSLTLARAGSRAGLRSGMQTLRNAFNNPGFRGGVTNFGNVFRPSSYLNALDDGLRVARAVRSTPLPVPSLASRALYGPTAATFADDLARIRLDHGASVVTSLHAGSVTALKGLGATASASTLTDALMDEGVPGFGAFDRFTNRHTTRQVGSL